MGPLVGLRAANVYNVLVVGNCIYSVIHKPYANVFDILSTMCGHSEMFEY